MAYMNHVHYKVICFVSCIYFFDFIFSFVCLETGLSSFIITTEITKYYEVQGDILQGLDLT